MPFRYFVRKKFVGDAPYTTRPDLGTSVKEDEVLSHLETASAVTRGDILNVFANLREYLLQAARDSRPSETLFGMFRVGLSCGGALDDPQQEISLEELGPKMELYAAAQLQKEFLAGLSVERSGLDGVRTPEIELIKNDLNDHIDTYTADDAILIKGDNLKFDEGDVAQGVFFTPQSGGAAVRATRYYDNTSGTIRARVPAGVTGAQLVTVTVQIGAHLRQTVYTNALAEE